MTLFAFIVVTPDFFLYPIAHPPPGVCDGGELSQGPHHRARQDRNTSKVFQPEAGRGADQESAAQCARPLGEAGAAVSGARASAGRCQEESQTGAVVCVCVFFSVVSVASVEMKLVKKQTYCLFLSTYLLLTL